MRNASLFLFLVLFIHLAKAQDSTSTRGSGEMSDSLNAKEYNKYGWLLRDDPTYNKKKTWLLPAGEVIATNVFVWSVDRYLFNAPFSKVSPSSWHTNFKKGWEWDNDRITVNFVGHPYSGSLYFNAARSNGYHYFQSLPYALGGSLLWEYFGETTRPSYNDLVNTTVSGSFLGEVLYRFSSKILNDKKQGGERVLREVAAAIVSPVRGFNRLIQGQTFRVNTKDVYQKEPLNVTLMGGVHYVNPDRSFATGSAVPMLNFQLDYGDPFEKRTRKPFDVFRLRVDLSQGAGLKLPNFINGYGLLGGRNHQIGKRIHLLGGFQHYDFWNTKYFQLASLGIGGGLISKIPLGRDIELFNSFHIAAVPLSGVNSRSGTDTAIYRNYNYGGGLQGKVETTLNLTKWISISLNGFYYWIHTYVGAPEIAYPQNSLAAIVKPKVCIWFTRNVSIGMEQLFYYTNAYPNTSTTGGHHWTEQKFFLQIFLENPRREGTRYF